MNPSPPLAVLVNGNGMRRDSGRDREQGLGG
jgi:hypothetical protein